MDKKELSQYLLKKYGDLPYHLPHNPYQWDTFCCYPDPPPAELLRITPPGEPTVPEIAKIGYICRTNYGIVPETEGRIVGVGSAKHYGYITYTISFVAPDAQPYKDGRFSSNQIAGWLNYCVAVGGQITSFFTITDDQIFVEPPPANAPAFQSRLF